jgi:hypothetical protein
MTSRTFVQGAIAVVLATLALAAAGCGGRAASPGVASLNGSSSTTGASPSAGGNPAATNPSFRQDLARFAACIRANGVPNFPDPNARGMFDVGGSSGIDPSSPQFQAVEKKCQSLEPAGWQLTPRQVAALYRQTFTFAECMRGQGIRDFPNPTLSNGVVTLNVRGHGDLDFSSPVFQKALAACRSSRPPGPGDSKSPGGN